MLSLISSNKVLLLITILKLILSISIVFSVKFIYINFSFPIIALTSLQFFFTFIGCMICLKLGLITHKKASIRHVIVSSILLGGFVATSNFSNDYNSIQVAQQFNFIQLPLILVLLSILNKRSYSAKIKLISLLICVPIFISSYHASDFDSDGIIFAIVCGIIGTINYWWTERKNNEVSVCQTLLYQTPITAVFLLIASFFFENNFDEFGLFSSSRPASEWVLVIFTCILSMVYFIANCYSIDVGNSSLSETNFINVATLIAGGFLGSLHFYDSFGYEQICSTVVVTIGVAIFSLFHTFEEAEAEKAFQSALI